VPPRLWSRFLPRSCQTCVSMHKKHHAREDEGVVRDVRMLSPRALQVGRRADANDPEPRPGEFARASVGRLGVSGRKERQLLAAGELVHAGRGTTYGLGWVAVGWRSRSAVMAQGRRECRAGGRPRHHHAVPDLPNWPRVLMDGPTRVCMRVLWGVLLDLALQHHPLVGMVVIAAAPIVVDVDRPEELATGKGRVATQPKNQGLAVESATDSALP